MNKTERLAVLALFGILMVWSFYGRRLMPEAPTPEMPTETHDDTAVPVAHPLLQTEPLPTTDAAESRPITVRHTAEETVVIRNDVLELTFSSWGGGLRSASLYAYNATMDAESGPVVFDFSDKRTLSYTGLPGLSEEDTFAIEADAIGNRVRITGVSRDGLRLTRTVELADNYALRVRDHLSNETGQSLAIRGVRLQLGPMPHLESGPAMRGMSSLGADWLQKADGKVMHRGKHLPKLFGSGGGCSGPDLRTAPLYAHEDIQDALEWVAVKNKFFTQILEPNDGIAAVRVRAGRDAEATAFTISTVSASLALPDLVLDPAETFEREMRYYVGPKKHALLKAEGRRWSEIMEFGRFFKPVCVVLLPLLNGIYRVVPGGYGIAIIVLTIIVKLVFWPVTHKGTESMKRMQKLQPELKKLREKYKNDPKKIQEKQMLLYREHKVNPLAGCLPMVIQIPVFIGLFTVLRSAVELRYARFLWIRDLSEPEGLLAGLLPFPAGGLNLLPLLMTATMVLQQKLTPSAGDPQQQKIMAYMPVMMLFIFYSMPSALVLYWTVSQGLSILQLVIQQRKDRLSAAVAPA